jgi:hypothetical protein
VTLKERDNEVGKFTFRFEQAEREWFRHILERYPVQQTPLNPIKEDAHANELLEQALGERRKKLRQDAEVFLKAGRLEIDAAFNEYWDLTLTAGEIEELLQILNNVRVGLWNQLGQPEASIEELLPTKPSEEQVRSHMIMHVCGAWQATLMSAVDPETPETKPG